MTYVISIIVFIIVFSILILVHEWGHFFAARKSGVKVEEFGIGLPPRAKGLFKDKKGTLYSLNWIPFGGFVRMYGEDSEDEKMRDKKGSFASKGVLSRTIIILAGVIMNFLLGFLLLVLLFTVGTKPFIVTQSDFDHYREQGILLAEEKVVVTNFEESSEADEAGLTKGDIVLSIDGNSISRNDDVISAIKEKTNESVMMTILREEDELTLSIPVNESGKMGVGIAEVPEILEIKEISYPFGEAIVQSGYETARLSYLTMNMFIQVVFDLFTKAEVSDQVAGPVGIAQLTHRATQEGGFFEILKLIALLSISLGAINVLPIPALDGGRFLSIIFEVITRRRPNAIWEARIHAIGFLLIIFLILAVTYNDIVRLITG